MKRTGIGFSIEALNFPLEVYKYPHPINALNIINAILKTKKKEEVKILIRPTFWGGIGDCLGNLNTVLFLACCCAEIPVSNITLAISGYNKNIEKCFVTDQLKIVWEDKFTRADSKQKFDLCIEGNSAHGLYIEHDFHFSKFVNYSDTIIQHAIKYSTYIAVYLRFYDCERKHISADELIKQFAEHFLSRWDASEQYIICSPHPIVKTQKWPSNVEISSCLCNNNLIPRYIHRQRAKLNPEDTVRDMAILSYSKDTIAFHPDAANFYAVSLFLAKNKVNLNPHTTEEILLKLKLNKIEAPLFNKILL
jgi:hypothetical protein